jgi:hypothetical protein
MRDSEINLDCTELRVDSVCAYRASSRIINLKMAVLSPRARGRVDVSHVSTDLDTGASDPALRGNFFHN